VLVEREPRSEVVPNTLILGLRSGTPNQHFSTFEIRHLFERRGWRLLPSCILDLAVGLGGVAHLRAKLQSYGSRLVKGGRENVAKLPWESFDKAVLVVSEGFDWKWEEKDDVWDYQDIV
jgi:hypothetical protein